MQFKIDYEVAIIGGGASGLLAALELAMAGKKVVIIEAVDRIGGRIHTVQDQRFEMPIESGAEFVHGKLPITLELFKKAGIEKEKVQGDVWRHRDGHFLKEQEFIEDYNEVVKKLNELKEDIPVAGFLDKYFAAPGQAETCNALKNYVEGYYAADTKSASSFALRDELQNSDDEQYRPTRGYHELINYLHQELKQKGVPVFLSAPVTHIHWQKGSAEVIAGNQSWFAKKVVITVSLGILQSGVIHFTPALPHKIKAAKALGFGNVIKIILQFDTAFWKDKNLTSGKDLGKLGFLFSEESIPTWWTQLPEQHAVLTGWCGGPHADALQHYSDTELVEKALHSLSSIFSVDVAFLKQNLKAARALNWLKNIYTLGAYSFAVVGGAENQQILKDPVEKTLFFAGEGLYEGLEIGTVEAALHSGRETAHRIIASF